MKKKAVFIIGIGDNENYIASDIPAVLEYTKKFYFVEDDEFAILSRENVEFYDNNLNKIEKELKEILWDANAADKNGYEDYMLKEIFEQPNSIRETVGSRLKLNEKTL